jgi:methionyl-tRNA formyltransferase
VHASLLPRWRGAAPIQRAILAGDAETGVCLMQMEAGLDTGPVLLSETTLIRDDDTGGSLHDRLAEIGAHVLGEGLRRLTASETLQATPQPAEGASYAHKLEKAEAKLDFTRPAIELERKVRAFNPWPVAEAEVSGERIRVWNALALPNLESRAPSPGSVLSASRHGIDVACGEGVLRILKLQRAGGRVIGADDYLNARAELRVR